MKKSYRVKSDKDFQAIFQSGQSVANRKFVVYSLDKQHPHFRAGISVSKKLGNAVKRNTIKRRIRHCLMELAPDLRQLDFVIIARKGVEELDYQGIKANLIHVFRLSNRYEKGSESETEI